MIQRTATTPQFVRLLQLAATLLAVIYMLLIGGSFDATLRYRVQLLNTLLACGLGFGWLLVRLRQRARLNTTGFEPALAAIVIGQFVATAASLQPRLSLELAVGVLTWALVFILLCDLLARGWPAEYLWSSLLIAGAVLAGQGLWEVAQWFAQWAGVGQLPPVAFRLNGLLGHGNLTAAALNLLLPLVVVKMLLTSQRLTRLALGGLAAAMLAAEFFSSSRAGWIAGAAALGLLGILLGWDKRSEFFHWLNTWRRWPVVAQGLTVILVLGGLSGAAWLVVRQTQHASHSSLLSGRELFWRSAWEAFLANPLTGAGPDLYPWLYPKTVSIPPGWLAPHAHSLFFQILGGSGLVGILSAASLAVIGARYLWRGWRSADGERALFAAVLSSLAGLTIHSLFDYLLSSPAITFLLVTISALAFAPRPASAARRYSAGRLALPMLAAAGITAFALRGAAWNDAGLQLAARNEWAQAAQAFRRAAQGDPAFTLYWEEAAQAATRAGETQLALPLWQQAADAEPYWAIPPAAYAVLTGDPMAMDAALARAPESDLLTLNAGALWEAAGTEALARDRYLRALDLNPAQARALFWAQTPLRAGVLAEWQTSRPPDESALAQGWAALNTGELEKARESFQQAQAQSPLSTSPYVGLARAYWALGDEGQAQKYLAEAERLPLVAIRPKIEILLLKGDWAAAHGDGAAAREAYTLVFSAVNDYTSEGPGTYGYPGRSRVVYHRNALPSDLIPQFAYADITPEMDRAFVQLAQWLGDSSESGTACFILARVYREAPQSASGTAWLERCR